MIQYVKLIKGCKMIFNKKHINLQFYSQKLSLKRKILIGLLAIATISGGINGYIQHHKKANNYFDKIKNAKINTQSNIQQNTRD